MRIIALDVHRSFAQTTLPRSWVLLVNRAGRFQPVSLYFNILGRSLPSQIGSEVGYSWPMRQRPPAQSRCES
jgi:hypothetical protein